MKQDVCQGCGKIKSKLVPAGVSKKTGKPYQAFYACENCKSVPKKTTNDLEARIGAKFMEIDERFKEIEDYIYNVKKAPEINVSEDEEGLPF